MRRGILIISLAVITLVGLTLGLALFSFPLLELALNRSTQTLFDRTLHLGKSEWKKNLGIRFTDVQVHFQAPTESVPIQIHLLESQNSILHLFSHQGAQFKFKGFQIVGSKKSGIEGTLRIGGGKKSFFELDATVKGIDLQELTWINPPRLEGSQGEIKGRIKIRQETGKPLLLVARLYVEEPGGLLQSQLFDLLKPYLPQVALNRKIRLIKVAGGLVGFRVAQLRAEKDEPDKMKIFLHLAVPDYNLDLNLKMQVHLSD